METNQEKILTIGTPDYSYCVYCHTNKINGKRYIGKSKKIGSRWAADGNSYLYKGSNSRNTIFANAIRKYGWDNFDHDILIDKLDNDSASFFEQYYIRLYKTNIFMFGKDYGYNMTSGGDGSPGRVISEDTRNKLRESHLGHVTSEETKEKLRKINSGKHLSEEAKRKISEKNSGRLIGYKRSQETIEKIRAASKLRGFTTEAREKSRLACIRKVICLDTGEVFDSMKEACDKYGISQTHLSAVCRGRSNSAKGMKWKYFDGAE